MTQTLIIHVIRTNKIPFIQSRASVPLTLTSLAIMAFGVWLPYSPLAAASASPACRDLLADPSRDSLLLRSADAIDQDVAAAPQLDLRLGILYSMAAIAGSARTRSARVAANRPKARHRSDPH